MDELIICKIVGNHKNKTVKYSDKYGLRIIAGAGESFKKYPPNLRRITKTSPKI